MRDDGRGESGSEIRDLLRAFVEKRSHQGDTKSLGSASSSTSARAAASKEDEDLFMERVAQLLRQSDNSCRYLSHRAAQLHRHLQQSTLQSSWSRTSI